jgi:DNA-binding transcriptional MerR regulator
VPSMAVQYRIGEFSDLSGVSTKTLRFYDEIGLLRPASVDARTGYRRYRSQQLEELASILVLKSLGLSLGDVRNQLSKAGSAKDRRELLFELKRSIEQSIQGASQSLKCIDAACRTGRFEASNFRCREASSRGPDRVCSCEG